MSTQNLIKITRTVSASVLRIFNTPSKENGEILNIVNFALVSNPRFDRLYLKTSYK